MAKKIRSSLFTSTEVEAVHLLIQKSAQKIRRRQINANEMHLHKLTL